MKGNFCQPQRQFSLEYFGIREARSMSMPRQLPAVAVSACMTGQAVRYDGGHRHQAELLDALADRLEILPLCPEFRLGIPRTPVQRVLTRQGQCQRLVEYETHLVVTKFAEHNMMTRHPTDAG